MYLAHCDFFKNNVRFRNTKRDMVESMAATAERIRKYEILYGKHEVEVFLDAVLAIEEHIDPSLMRPKLAWDVEDTDFEEEDEKALLHMMIYGILMKLNSLNRKKTNHKRNFPPQPEKDYYSLLSNIVEN